MKSKKFTLSDWASICVILTLVITMVTLWPTIWGWNRFWVKMSDMPERMDAIEQRQDRTEKNIAAIGHHFGVPMVSEDAPVGKVPIKQSEPEQWAIEQRRPLYFGYGKIITQLD